jgi:hypothetical protein
MAGGERLAEGAGVEGLDILVGHLVDTLVTVFVFGPCPSVSLSTSSFVGIERYLDLVDYLLEILMELGMQHDTDIFQGKTLSR